MSDIAWEKAHSRSQIREQRKFQVVIKSIIRAITLNVLYLKCILARNGKKIQLHFIKMVI